MPPQVEGPDQRTYRPDEPQGAVVEHIIGRLHLRYPLLNLAPAWMKMCPFPDIAGSARVQASASTPDGGHLFIKLIPFPRLISPRRRSPWKGSRLFRLSKPDRSAADRSARHECSDRATRRQQQPRCRRNRSSLPAHLQFKAMVRSGGTSPTCEVIRIHRSCTYRSVRQDCDRSPCPYQ